MKTKIDEILAMLLRQQRRDMDIPVTMMTIDIAGGMSSACMYMPVLLRMHSTVCGTCSAHVCTYVYTHVYVNVCMRVYTHVYTHVYVHVEMRVYAHVYTNVYTHVRTNVGLLEPPRNHHKDG